MPHKELYLDGIWHPSVTTVMDVKPKPWLDAWKDKWGILAVRKTKIANAIGTEFHRCVEQWLDTGRYTVIPPMADEFPLPSTMPRVEGMMRSFVAWAATIDGIIEHTEMQVISRRYIYSGTLDAVGKLGKKPTLFDWKTSSRIYPDMGLQLSAYAQAYNEEHMGSPQVKEGLIVHVSKDKPHFKLTTKPFKLGKRLFKEFMKLRQMFDDMQSSTVK